MVNIAFLAQLLELGKATLHGTLLTSGHISSTTTAGGIESTLAVMCDHVTEGLFLERLLAFLGREKMLAGVGQDSSRRQQKAGNGRQSR